MENFTFPRGISSLCFGLFLSFMSFFVFLSFFFSFFVFLCVVYMTVFLCIRQYQWPSRPSVVDFNNKNKNFTGYKTNTAILQCCPNILWNLVRNFELCRFCGCFVTSNAPLSAWQTDGTDRPPAFTTRRLRQLSLFRFLRRVSAAVPGG